MEYNPLVSHVHKQAIAEVVGTLHEWEMSCHNQFQLPYHYHKLAEHHCVALSWCHLQDDWSVVSVLGQTRHDQGICEMYLWHRCKKNDGGHR